MFESDTYICSGFIHVTRDSICDVTTVGGHHRQVVFSSEPHGNKLTVLLTVVPTHKGSERSVYDAAAIVFNKYKIEYNVIFYMYI